MRAPPPVLFRGFAGPSDFPAMVACANASFAADDTGFFRTVDDMARDYASFTSCVPAHDVWIAQAGPDIAGYVRCWCWQQPDGLQLYAQFGVVAPAWRGRGVGTALQHWLEARQRAQAAALPQARHAHHVYVTGGEVARAALLQRFGYRPERHILTMVRPDLEAIVDLPLPDGLALRPAEPQHYRAIWDAHVRAFQTHWGAWGPDEADYQRWLHGTLFQPQLWQVAWDRATGTVAGQVRTFIDPTWNAANGRLRGWTEFISVGQAWRRRGVARALIMRSLRAQQRAGMQESALGVDSQNSDGALGLYEDCGFVVTTRNAAYRKPLQL